MSMTKLLVKAPLSKSLHKDQSLTCPVQKCLQQRSKMESSDQHPLKVDQGNLQPANQWVNNTKEAWLPWTTVNQAIKSDQELRKGTIKHTFWQSWYQSQGVVTYMSALEAFATHDQVFWSAKSVLDHLIDPFWGSWSLDLQGSKVTLQSCVLDCWF